MRRAAPAATRVATWGLAVLLVVLLDAGLTRTRVLWGPTPFEDTRELSKIVVAQTYQAARAVYAAPVSGDRPIVLLGNSRIWLPARPAFVEPALARRSTRGSPRVVNLGIFGADARDVEALSRHVDALAPALVVVCLGTSDLIPDPATPWPTLTTRVFDLGWRDGPLSPASMAARVDRWLRTGWRLYRFREFARPVLLDRVVPTPDPGPFPTHFADTRALFDYMDGASAEQVDAAYAAWRRDPTLERFVAYLRTGSAPHLENARRRARDSAQLDPSAPGVHALDALLARLGPRGAAQVLLMPENPLLAEDGRGEYHRPGFSDVAAALVATLAERHGVAFVDARRWMPPEAFLDFDHLLPDLSGFQEPLAEDLTRALRS